jgi:hypothetical protein
VEKETRVHDWLTGCNGKSTPYEAQSERCQDTRN